MVVRDGLTCRSSFGDAGFVLVLYMALSNRAVVLSVVREYALPEAAWFCSRASCHYWTPHHGAMAIGYFCFFGAAVVNVVICVK